MRGTFVFAVLLSLTCSGFVPAQPVDESWRLDDVLLLIQSELDHLERADRKIDVALDDVSPKEALRRIEKAAGIDIEIDGKLPPSPTLDKTFKATSLREILEWLAPRVDVVYRVERGKTLVVFARARE